MRKTIACRFVVCVLLVCMAGSVRLAWAEDPPAFVPGSWTLVVLPDTQRYTDEETDPGLTIFPAITQWIADNKQSRNIQYVLHEGDIVDEAHGGTIEMWQVASDAMAILDKAGIPFCMAPGNHDYEGNAVSRNTLLNRFFSISRYQAMPTFGGTFEPRRTENNYHLFSAGGKDYIAIALEYGPRNETVAWANRILSKHSDRTAFIVTHIYTSTDGSRYNWAAKGRSQIYNAHASWSPLGAPHDGTANVNDGEQLWQKLVSRHKNIQMVFSGHVPWAGVRQKAIGKHGQIVHEMVAAYHHPAEGWIRLLEFRPDGRTVRVKTFSPHLDKYMTDDDQQFVLDVAPLPTE